MMSGKWGGGGGGGVMFIQKHLWALKPFKISILYQKSTENILPV